jgi:hypothetical protein
MSNQIIRCRTRVSIRLQRTLYRLLFSPGRQQSCFVFGTYRDQILVRISSTSFQKPSSINKRWRSWLRHCATSRKLAGSIPDGITGIFHWHNPSRCNMALGLIQPLIEMSTRNISWGQKRPVLRADVTTFMCQLSWNLGASTSWNPQGLSRPVQACNGVALPLSQPTLYGLTYWHSPYKAHKWRAVTLRKSGLW